MNSTNLNAIARLRAQRNHLDRRIQELQEPEGHVLRNKIKQLQEEHQKPKKNFKKLEKKLEIQEQKIVELTRHLEQQPNQQRFYLAPQQLPQYMAPQQLPPQQLPLQHMAPQQPPEYLAPQQPPEYLAPQQPQQN
ncbi:hypothetical protein ACLKA6_019795 [Drosophila palustris]